MHTPTSFLIQICDDSGMVIDPDHGRSQRYESENMMINMQKDQIQVIQGIIALAGQTT